MTPSANPTLPPPAEWALQLAAQAWCEPTTGKSVMDAELAIVFAQILTREVSRTSAPAAVEGAKPRRELLTLAESCGAELTGKPDGSESITVVFTIKAWRTFDTALAAQHPTAPDTEAASRSPAGQLAEMEARKDAAYLERNQVVAALAKVFPSGVARTAIEGWSEDWHGCVYIDLPTGQASWHFHDSQAYLFDGLPPYKGHWDGHTTEEKYDRLAALAGQAVAVEAEPVKADPEHMKMQRDAGYWRALTCAISTRGAKLEIVEHRGRRGWDCTFGNTTSRARTSPEAALHSAIMLEFDGNVPEVFGLPPSTVTKLVHSDAALPPQPAALQPPQVAREPLTMAEREKLYHETHSLRSERSAFMAGLYAAERFHGITPPAAKEAP